MKKILIIDDDRDILETTGSLLESEGFEIHSAQTVERGVQMIDEVQPDLILLDIMFPEKKAHGFEAAGRIRSRHPHIPIFVLTAVNRQYAFEFNKEDVQAEEFLNKPVPIAKLVKLINSYI
jgi:two-component system response regulator VicR